jgi:hypothetical protein
MIPLTEKQLLKNLAKCVKKMIMKTRMIRRTLMTTVFFLRKYRSRKKTKVLTEEQDTSGEVSTEQPVLTRTMHFVMILKKNIQQKLE